MTDNAPRSALSARMVRQQRRGEGWRFRSYRSADPLVSFAKDSKSLKGAMDASSATSSSSSSDVASIDYVKRAASSLPSKDKRSTGNKRAAPAGTTSSMTAIWSTLDRRGLDDVLSQINVACGSFLCGASDSVGTAGDTAPSGVCCFTGTQDVARLCWRGSWGNTESLQADNNRQRAGDHGCSWDRPRRTCVRYSTASEIYYEYKKDYGDEMSSRHCT
ncbi:hypothetical protein ACHAW5_004275 [Stephanodiscus triporus]|uniref:Uncharacterized protein n=1 Tax=Stephanodiscus triporus TaxID=2934178 RepID=A0ABD3MFY4_9STRA